MGDLPEFDRPGSSTREDYIAGLLAELALATEENRAGIKAELDRVAGPRTTETATAPRAEEVA
jgi:hypothetical protein